MGIHSKLEGKRAAKVETWRFGVTATFEKEKPMRLSESTQDIIPSQLKKNCYALVEASHKGHSYRTLLARVVTKESMVAIACVPKAFAIMKAQNVAWKIRVACWFVYVALAVCGFFYNRWILLALIPVFIADRWLASVERTSLMALGATLLVLEILADDFAGWGAAFPDERKRASDILGADFERSQPSWLDFYFPRRSELEPEFFKGFGPS